jgi:hypothetical protein
MLISMMELSQLVVSQRELRPRMSRLDVASLQWHWKPIQEQQMQDLI